MDKVEVRTKALSRALFSFAAAGCDTVEVSVVAYAVRVEGISGDSTLVLHVWSKEAEDTEACVGKGERQLTEEEIELLDTGKCPLCEDRKQLSKGPKAALAINVNCDAGHLFWVPPKPFVPEYLGQRSDTAEQVKESVEQLESEQATEEALGEVKEQEETSEVSDTK